MTWNFTVFGNKWSYELDDTALKIHIGRPVGRSVTVEIPCSAVIGAGYVDAKNLPPPDGTRADLAPNIVPGFGGLLRRGVAESDALQQILFAYRLPSGKKKLFTAVARLGHEGDSLLAELRRRLAQRWIADAPTIIALRRRLGYSNLWISSVYLLALAVALIVLLGLIAVGFGSTFALR